MTNIGKGSKIIATVGLAIAVICGATFGYSSFKASDAEIQSCKQRLSAWQADHAKAASSEKKPVGQMSDDEILNLFTKSAPQPQCGAVGFAKPLEEGVITACFIYVAVFLLAHACWLLARAYKKLMNKLA